MRTKGEIIERIKSIEIVKEKLREEHHRTKSHSTFLEIVEVTNQIIALRWVLGEGER